MAASRILILGGYGEAGRAIARSLVTETPCSVILAGRHRDQADAAADTLNREYGADRVVGRAVDAADSPDLARVLDGVDLVINCLPHYESVVPVTEAAIIAGVDAIDILYSQEKVHLLKALESRIFDAGRCVVTEAGVHPGMAAVLVRLAARRLSRIRSANVGLLINEPMPDTGAADEVAEEMLHMRPMEYRDGAWREFTYRSVPTMDFGSPVGRRPIYPINLEEMRGLPESLGLEETGAYVAGFGLSADMALMLPGMALEKLHRGWGISVLGKMMMWGYRAFAKKPYGAVMKVEAAGETDAGPARLDMSVGSPSGYGLTAIAVVAFILQYLDGAIGPGLHIMGNAVDTARMLRDMERMGASVVETVSRV